MALYALGTNQNKGFLTGNRILDLAILAWFLAQMMKVLLELFFQKKFNWSTLFGSGGMPSSHSAFVCALAVSSGIICGLQSPVFAIAAGLAVIVMYDAFNVRRAAGEHARHLNELMMEYLKEKPTAERNFKLLRESLGHTPLQVLMGALLGIGIGCLAFM